MTKPQSDFFKLECKYPLFVAGYGSGKTFTLIAAAVRDLLIHKGARIGVYSDTYDQLRLNIIPRFEEMFEEAGVRYTFNKSENVMCVGSNEIVLRSIDNPKRIIGYETFRSHVDEIEASTTEVKANDVWRKIMARNRQKCGTHANRVSAYTTPDQGFGFTYKKWGRLKSKDYQYVQASTVSNPHLPSDYVDSLSADYTDGLVDAYLMGAWCNLTSGSVYPSFNRLHHNTVQRIKDGEPLHIGMDFNVNNMAAVVFNSDGDAIHELVGYADTPSTIRAIKDRFAGHHITIYPDASGRASSSKNASLSDIKILKDAGFTVKAKPTNPRVRDRIVTVNKHIADGRICVNVDQCPQLAEALEQQAYDKNGEPDKTSGHDHVLDAFGYQVAYRFPLKTAHNKNQRWYK